MLSFCRSRSYSCGESWIAAARLPDSNLESNSKASGFGAIETFFVFGTIIFLRPAEFIVSCGGFSSEFMLTVRSIGFVMSS